MSLSSVEDIETTVDFDNSGVSFISSYGDMIQNVKYAQGSRCYNNGEDNRNSFFYKALSAVGDQIGDALYQNIRNYIDYVSNVDICKIKSLKSMLQMFGFKYTIVDNIEKLPFEIVDLMNVLSINKKYLVKNGVLNAKFLNELLSADDAPLYVNEKKTNFRKYFANNAYVLSGSNGIANAANVSSVAKLFGLYQQISSFELSSDEGRADSYLQWVSDNISNQLSCKCYSNNYNYFMVDDLSNSKFTLYSNNYSKLFQIPEYGTIESLSSIGDYSEIQISDIIQKFKNTPEYLSFSNDFLETNAKMKLQMLFYNIDFSEDLSCIDDQKYQSYIAQLYYDFLYGQLTWKFNAKFIDDTQEKEIYVYPYLGDMYYNKDYVTFNSLENAEDAILSTKSYWHIPSSFDEQKIVDDIDDGNDSLDNYQGIQLSVLQMEIKKRQNPLDLASIGIEGNTSKILQTRYSYYRQKKVAEYAKFIDNYYSTAISSEAKIYGYDSNYYEIKASELSVISCKNASKANPDIDINKEIIRFVANYLAQLTTYVCKIREKIKLQTQKNYMKGTNLLLIYVVNEFLNEYALHNKNLFFNDDGTIKPQLSGIYANLSCHQLAYSGDPGNYLIKVDEHYDTTQYFNIETQSTTSAENKSQANDRYWELTSTANPVPILHDGDAFTLNQIENLYLSVFNMKDVLSDSQEFSNFMQSIYDLGANDSFIYDLSGNSKLSVFSSQLVGNNISDVVFASDIYNELVSLSSAYLKLNAWLSDGIYSYPEDTTGNQLTNVVDGFILSTLSSTYLSSVSSIYSILSGNVLSLSNDIESLSGSYQAFISGDYAYYYNKFENKYCYSNYDIDNGTYMFDYYVGNSDYTTDDMQLYEHLYQLRTYSTSTNIQNHALRFMSEDVLSQFKVAFSTLNNNIVDTLESDYGFIDIKSEKLDEEINYVNDFVVQKKEERIEFLKTQLANLLSQANSLKSTYDTLENTFTQAMASYDDNHTTYSYKDNQTIYCVTSTELTDKLIKQAGSGVYVDDDGKAINRCKRSADQPGSKSTYVFCHKYTDSTGYSVHSSTSTTRNYYWYYGANTALSAGSYGFEAKNYVEYNDTDSLEARCTSIQDYMDTPTMMIWSKTEESGEEDPVYQKTYIYGLRSDGTQASINSIQTGLANLKTSYNSVANLAKTLYGIDPTSSGANELYDLILSLISLLTNYDQTVFNQDSQVKACNSLISEILQISGDYIDMKAEYDSIFSDSSQSTYLQNFTNTGVFTQETIENLIRYCKQSDNSNFNDITSQIGDMIDVKFQNLLDTKNAIEVSANEMGVAISYTTGTAIEDYTQTLHDALVNDVVEKTVSGWEIIDGYMSDVYECQNIISTEISTYLSTTTNFDTAVGNRLDELNFFNHQIYNRWRNVFLTYGGRDFCYDPYYNIQNQTHPSYQVHPYVWNYVKKSNNQTLIESTFKSKVVSDLEEDQSTSKLSKYLGSYGQTIDTWKNFQNGLVDYSGYASRYEKSSNTSKNTGTYNEVVDYDGIFYPPAVHQFIENPEQCINSVSCMATQLVIRRQLATELDSIDNCVLFDEYGNVISNDIYEKSKPIIEQFVDSKNLSKTIDEYLENNTKSTISMTGLLNVVCSCIPDTFYEKYYKHIGMEQTQCQFVAQQLEEYEDDIIDVAQTQLVKNSYDIYKYGVDIQGNAYILLKKYGCSTVSELEKLSFKEKQNTKGVMWIRLVDSPIAFPAFSGTHTQYYFKNLSGMQPAIRRLAQLKYNGITTSDDSLQTIQRINNSMQYFYDFEITQDQKSISYIVHNANLENTRFASRFDLAWVVADRIHEESIGNYSMLVFSNSSDDGTSYSYDYIDFNPVDGMLKSFIGEGSLLDANDLEKGVCHAALAGYYVYDQSSIDFVYVFKKFTTEDATIYKQTNSSDSKSMFVVKITNGTSVYTASSKYSLAENYEIDNDEVCTAYDKNTNSLTLAFIAKNSKSKCYVETTDNEIDMQTDSAGSTSKDPTIDESNSYDVFTRDVLLLKFNRTSKKVKYVSTEQYNQNADISYIPVYAGAQHEANIDKISSKNYNCIELLGMSKDIDSKIMLVNTHPNPYFDYNTIVEKYVHGRVYEDYDPSSDRTFAMTSNPSLNSNMPCDQLPADAYQLAIAKQSFDGKGIGSYVFNLNLDKLHTTAYTANELDHLQLMIFNADSLGKRPYFIGHLSALQQETEFMYDETDEIDETTVEKSEGTTVTVVGTPSSLTNSARSTSNSIDGIECITGQVQGHNRLVLRFYYNSLDASVGEQKIQIVVYNSNDVKLLKYCHLLDAYGIVRSDMKTISGQISGMISSYYIDDSGNKVYLKDIELSDYESLSDIYILSGNQRLSFKIDEQLRFDVSSDLYSYPSLNVNYPKTAGQYDFKGQLIDSGSNSSLSIFENVLNDSNTYIMSFDDSASVVSSIGLVDIPYLDDVVYDVRAYESYLEDDNYKKYDIGDARILQFLKFTDNKNNILTGSSISSFEIDEQNWVSKDADEVARYINDTYKIYSVGSEQDNQTGVAIYNRVDASQISDDISDFLKVRANYKVDKDSGEIALYFNYQNYINSPYIKLVDGKQYLDIVDGTYLRLGQDEDGILDIILQMKMYDGNAIVGFKNIKVLSYHIYNVSDDKPKFVIQKTFQVQKNSNVATTVDDASLTASIYADDIDLSQTDDQNSYLDVNANVYVKCDRRMTSNYKIFASYPANILSLDENIDSSAGYYLGEETNLDDGIVEMVVNNPKRQSFTLKFKTTLPVKLLASYAGSYYSLMLNDVEAYIDGIKVAIAELNDHDFTILKNDTCLLASYIDEDTTSIYVDKKLNTMVRVE